MTTSDTIADYFSHLKQGAGWESFLADDMVFTSFTTPVKQVPDELHTSSPRSASIR